MAIARFPTFVIDCPDPAALAGFYGTLLGWEVQDQADGLGCRRPDGERVTAREGHTPRVGKTTGGGAAILVP